jgi:hypothetical protein
MSDGHQEYELGKSAGLEGKPHTSNPFLEGSGLNIAWDNGWERGHFAKALDEAQQVEEFSCAECSEGKGQRVLTPKGNWIWNPESDLGIYREPDQKADSDYWLFCRLCSSVFERNWKEQLKQDLSSESFETRIGNQNHEQGQTCYVYLVQSNQLVRIGKAKSETRFMSYKTSLPDSAEVLKTWLLSSEHQALFIEKSLHQKYSDFKVRGSWYRLPPIEIEKLVSVKDLEKFV